MLVVHGFYDGKVVVPKAEIPYKDAVDVLITFPDNDVGELTVADKLNALRDIVGVIAGNTMTLDNAKVARLAKQ